MHEKPNLPGEQLIECLWQDYGLPVKRLEFLPTGANVNTAVYRAETKDGIACFAKLRDFTFETDQSGMFD